MSQLKNAPALKTEPKSLGRGLDTLFGTQSGTTSSLKRNEGLTTIAVNLLKPGKYQPRTEFDDESLGELSHSIKENGLLQPILVRPTGGKDKFGNPIYEIVAGERRWRACKKAGLKRIPVILKEMTETEALENALLENIQRDNLNAMEEAKGYKRLADEFGYDATQIGKSLGKSRSHVVNTMRLLQLPEKIQGFLASRQLSPGHARALLGASDMEAVAEQAIAEKLSVRGTEALVANLEGRTRQTRPRHGSAKPTLTSSVKTTAPKKTKNKPRLVLSAAEQGKLRALSASGTTTLDPESQAVIDHMKKTIADILSMPCDITLNQDGSGEIRLSIKSFEELDDFMNTIHSAAA